MKHLPIFHVHSLEIDTLFKYCKLSVNFSNGKIACISSIYDKYEPIEMSSASVVIYFGLYDDFDIDLINTLHCAVIYATVKRNEYLESGYIWIQVDTKVKYMGDLVSSKVYLYYLDVPYSRMKNTEVSFSFFENVLFHRKFHAHLLKRKDKIILESYGKEILAHEQNIDDARRIYLLLSLISSINEKNIENKDFIELLSEISPMLPKEYYFTIRKFYSLQLT